MGTEITYKTNKLKQECNDLAAAKRSYGNNTAEKLHQRIDELRAGKNVEVLVQYSIGRCHPLKGNRDGQFSMDLVQPYRLIFEKKGLELSIVRVLCVEDYH